MLAIRLAELLGRWSLAFDIAADASPGRAVRSTVLATELATRAGVTGDSLRNTYWSTLLGHLGSLLRRPPVAKRLFLDPPRLDPTGTMAAESSEQASAARAEVSADPHVFERFLELEPGSVEWVREARQDDMARTLATLVDLTSPIFAGHSTGVADLAERAAAQIGTSADEMHVLRLAAHLHDIGRVSVPNDIWERPGPLDWAAWERIRLHPYYTERVLAPIEALAEVAPVASAAHERLEGSGYPRRRSARGLCRSARVLAAAHAAYALGESRPHRAPVRPEAIARELVAEAASGRLDSRAVDAVLASLGVPNAAAPPRSGLTGRELEVSKLLARGKSDKEISATLQISPRTVQVHVARIFNKLGVRNRAGAAVWLIEHDMAV